MSSPFDYSRIPLTKLLSDEVLAVASSLSPVGTSQGSGALWITITGSGGKTSLMESLACQLARKENRRVIISTTTRLASFADHSYPCDHMVLDGKLNRLDGHPSAGEVVVFGTLEKGKIAYPGREQLEALDSCCDVLLLEGDGARHRPLKIHAERDPIIPARTQLVIAVMGLSALGKPIDDDSCYLADRYRQLCDDRLHTVGTGMYRKLLDHPQGVFKGVSGQRVVLVLNQSDRLDAAEFLELRMKMIADWKGIPYLFVAGSVKEDIVIYHEEVMGSNPVKGAFDADI